MPYNHKHPGSLKQDGPEKGTAQVAKDVKEPSIRSTGSLGFRREGRTSPMPEYNFGICQKPESRDVRGCQGLSGVVRNWQGVAGGPQIKDLSRGELVVPPHLRARDKQWTCEAKIDQPQKYQVCPLIIAENVSSRHQPPEEIPSK